MGFFSRLIIVKELKHTLCKLSQSAPSCQENVHRRLKVWMAENAGPGTELEKAQVYQQCVQMRQIAARIHGDYTEDWFYWALCESVSMVLLLDARGDVKTAIAMKEAIEPFLQTGRA